VANSTDHDCGPRFPKDAEEISSHSRYPTEEDDSACEKPAKGILPEQKCHNFVGKENLCVRVATKVFFHICKGMISPFRTRLGREIGIVREDEGASAFQMPEEITGYLLFDWESVRVVQRA
jgi:hypothetical protein